MTATSSYRCNTCGWVYNPEQGDPDGGIAAGTRWEDIPDDWVCPVCGVGKQDFELIVPQVAEAPSPGPAHAPAAPVPLVIVGSGLAGYAVAKEIRKRDADLAILILTADGGEVYSKPMLSNALARANTPEAMVQKDAATMAADLDIEIRPRCRVTAIDRTQRSLQVATPAGSVHQAYDRLVLALGADPRVFPAPGYEAVGIATVNDLDDYRRWRKQIGGSGRVLLIGAGLIGCEFANDLAAAGFEVAIVDPAPWPLSRLLPEQIGAMLVAALQAIGCRVHMGRTVTRYLRRDEGLVAVLDDGSELLFDHALSAVGLTPRVELARAAGLEVDAGIRIDRRMGTRDPAIFALGDCAQSEAGLLPFIAPLLAQARALAATLCGEPTVLQLPALPVVVKTPALPLVVCPPPAGSLGAWDVEADTDGAMALFRDPDGKALGFALAGVRTREQQQLAQRMPALLPTEAVESATETAAGCFECAVCGYVYDPAKGDPDGGIAPGTRWEDIPDDWVCPTCGAGKADFSALV